MIRWGLSGARSSFSAKSTRQKAAAGRSLGTDRALTTGFASLSLQVLLFAPERSILVFACQTRQPRKCP